MGTLTVDPKNTEHFLLAQEDVLDASVWYDGAALRAHVTLAPGAKTDEHHLKSACLTQLGFASTPNAIVVVAPRTGV